MVSSPSSTLPKLPKTSSSRFYVMDSSNTAAETPSYQLQVTGIDNLDKSKSTSDIDLARASALASMTPPLPTPASTLPTQEMDEKKVSSFQDPRVPNICSKANSFPRSVDSVSTSSVMKKVASPKCKKAGKLGRVKSLGLLSSNKPLASNVLARLAISKANRNSMLCPRSQIVLLSNCYFFTYYRSTFSLIIVIGIFFF